LKFLCDNCKAKYQIADEKVAGKTVRMKCRKCGHQIEVRAAVTETSVSTSPPNGGPAAEATRPVGTKGSLATSLSAAKPRAPMAPQQPSSALAGAFQRTVQDAPQSTPFGTQTSTLELSVTDEWYVAINGVPVGPVRISELRRKAASGAVTEDSLCWQEGLEEWRPVRSIPELAAIVREAAQGNRPSLVAPQPNEGNRASRPPPPPQRPAPPGRAPEAPRAPAPFEAGRTALGASQRSNVVPLRVGVGVGVAASSTGLDDGQSAAMGGAAAAFAPSFSPSPSPEPARISSPLFAPQPTPPPAPIATADPFAIPPAPIAADSRASLVSPPSIAYAPAQGQPRRGVPLWFWLVLVLTGAFGVTAAMFVFRQPAPAPVVIQMPPTSTATAADLKADIPPPTASSEPAAVASSTPGVKVAAVAPKAGTPAAPAPTTPEKKGLDVSGLLGGAGGPNVGAGGPSATGGGGLDSASVERVVAAHRAGVKRTCWERGGADQKSSVNVTVSATVGPDGSVAGTSSSGDDPVVAKCIEQQVKAWRFNAPGSTTTVNIPFKFVRQ
jgi:predicted Zn finger-like uncharacterized protein